MIAVLARFLLPALAAFDNIDFEATPPPPPAHGVGVSVWGVGFKAACLRCGVQLYKLRMQG